MLKMRAWTILDQINLWRELGGKCAAKALLWRRSGKGRKTRRPRFLRASAARLLTGKERGRQTAVAIFGRTAGIRFSGGLCRVAARGASRT